MCTYISIIITVNGFFIIIVIFIITVIIIFPIDIITLSLLSLIIITCVTNCYQKNSIVNFEIKKITGEQ